ncbi:MAG: Ig-like domain-containing protein, partial [Thiopseudomonas sp.]|nr:Ig-like domain-containing protein [Thiopseudomonas sp.]
MAGKNHTQPLLSSIDPAHKTSVLYSDAGETSAYPQIKLTFDKPMNRASVETAFELYRYNDAGTATDTQYLGGFLFAWDTDNQTVSLSIKVALEYSRAYGVKLVKATAKDIFGNSLSGIKNITSIGSDGADSIVWNFKTDSGDKPSISTITFVRDRRIVDAEFAANVGVGADISEDLTDFGIYYTTLIGDTSPTDWHDQLHVPAHLTATNHVEGNADYETGRITCTFDQDNFTQVNTPYYLTPYVITVDGFIHFGTTKQTVVVHPWNLRDDNNTPTVLDKQTTDLTTNAFIIENVADLTNLNLADLTSAGLKGTTTLDDLITSYWTQPCNFVQTADIALTDTWVTVGNTAKPFLGSYNGQGYNITGLGITAASDDVGLFGVVGNATGGIISNINVAGHISGATFDNIGGVVGRLVKGSIENCESKVTITGTGTNIGGVVGSVADVGTIKECRYNIGNTIADTVTYDTDGIKGSSDIGCIAGYNAGAVTDCQCLNTSHNHRIQNYSYPYLTGGITLSPTFDAYVQSNVKTSPVAAIVTPVNTATEVIVNKPFEVNFSKPMDKATVLSAMSLTPKKIGNADDDTALTSASFDFEWDTTDSQVLITPKAPLAYNRTHALTISTAATDKYGNAISAVTHNFITESKISVKSITPSTASETLPITFLKDTGFIATFSDPLTPEQQASVVAATTIKDEQDTLTYSASWNANCNVLTLKTGANSKWDNNITLTIGGLTEDGGDLSATSRTHVVQTVLQPQILYRVPVPLGVTDLSGDGLPYLDNIKLNEAIILRFNKPMDTSAENTEKITATASNLLSSTGTFEPPILPFKKNWSQDGRMLVINNANAGKFWEYNASYTVTIPTTVLDGDTYGGVYYKNNLDEVYSFQFKTTTEINVEVALNQNATSTYMPEDYMALPVEFLNTNDFTYLPLNPDGTNAGSRIRGRGIRITYSEIVLDKPGVQSKIKLYRTDGTLPTELTATNFEDLVNVVEVPITSFDWVDNLLYVRTGVNLEYDSYHVLRVDGLTNAVGDALDPYNWYFKTLARPQVIGVSPASGLNKSLITQPISMSFDKEMMTETISDALIAGASAGSVKLYEVTGAVVATATDPLVPLADFTWAADYKSFIASPAETLKPNQKYYVEYSLADIQDTRENSIAASGYDGWYFTTSQQTDISRISLKSGGTAVDNLFDAPINSDVVVDFVAPLLDNQPDQQNSVTVTIIGVNKSDGSAAEPRTLTKSWAVDDKTLTLTPDLPLEYFTKYTVKISNLMDANGFVLPEEIYYDFQTASQPYIVSVYPAKDTLTMKPTDPIVVHFSKRMDSDVADQFVLARAEQGGADLTYTDGDMTVATDYTTALSADGKILTFTPVANIKSVDERWDYNTQYTLNGAGITDSLGNPLTDINSFLGSTFTTVYSSDVATFTLGANDLDTPVAHFKDTGIAVTFTEPLSTAQKNAIVASATLYTQVGAGAIKTPVIATAWTTVGDASANTNDSILTIKSADPLDYSASCTVEIGALTDENGSTTNVPARHFTFHTAAQPVVLSARPTSDILAAGSVAVTEPIIITFSKAMQTYDEATTKSLLTITESVPGTALHTFVAADYSAAWDSTKTVLTLTPKERANVYGDVFRYSASYTVTLSADFEDANSDKINQTADIDFANAGVQTDNFSFKTKSSVAPSFTNLVVSRDRLNVVASFTAIVVDGAPIDIAADKVGVITYKQAGTPGNITGSKPADDGVIVDYHSVTIKENGSVESAMILEADTVYWLVPYVETIYNNDSSNTFFAGEPVKVVVHPWNLENNQLGLASDTTALVDADADNNPFIIETAADLTALSATTVTAYWTKPCDFIQTKNIGAVTFAKPIGDADATAFTGTYNGQNYSVAGLTVTGNANYAGMFGVVDGATISNINISAVTVANTNAPANVGSLVGSVLSTAKASTITNVNVSAVDLSAVTAAANIGGLVGIVGGANAVTISDSSVTVAAATTISSTNVAGSVGGVVGKVSAANVTVSDNLVSYATDAHLVVSSGTAGCIVGNETGLAASLYNKDTITSTSIAGAIEYTIIGNICSCAQHEHPVNTKSNDFMAGKYYTEPLLSSILPLHNADVSSATIGDISVYPQITMTFDKPMNRTFVESALKLYRHNDAGAVTATTYDGGFEFTWDADSQRVQAEPKTALEFSRAYTAELTKATAEDIYANSVADIKLPAVVGTNNETIIR